MKTGDLFIADPKILGHWTWALLYYTKVTDSLRTQAEYVWGLLGAPLVTQGPYVYVGEARATNYTTRAAYLTPDGKIIYCKYGTLVSL